MFDAASEDTVQFDKPGATGLASAARECGACAAHSKLLWLDDRVVDPSWTFQHGLYASRQRG